MNPLRSAAVCAALTFVAYGADAQWSPSRPVRLIVPFPAGGAVDVVARIVAAGLPERINRV